MGKVVELILRLGGAYRPDAIFPPGMVFCSAGSAGGVNIRQWTRSTRNSPFGRVVLEGGGTIFGEHRINRYISDSDHNYFGYDLFLDSAERGAVYRLAFEPLIARPAWRERHV
jgi:hypothetical protein